MGRIKYVSAKFIDGLLANEGRFVASAPFSQAVTRPSSTCPIVVRTKSMASSHGPGSVSVIDFARRAVKVTWFIPGGGSPDMGNVSADGKMLWLSGRFDDVVYAIDTTSGQVKTIPVGREPHGLTVWPQPGRYSLGHTGNMR